MDNLSVQNHLRGLAGVGRLGEKPEIVPVGEAGRVEPDGGPEFKDMLAESIQKVNGLLTESDQAVQDLATGQSGNVHHTLIALQKADISFRMLLEVRNKVMRAYEEVMRMQA